MLFKSKLPFGNKAITLVLLFTGVPSFSTEFLPAQTIEVGGQSPKYVSADFNNDGVDDFAVVVPNKRATAFKVNFITGVADPDFPIQSSFRLQKNVRHITTGDFNGDNIQDLAFSHPPVFGSSEPDTIAVYLGKGGNFKFEFANSHVNIPTAQIPFIKKFSVFDANNDGLDDLLVDGHVRLSAGDGSFYQDTAIAPLIGSPTYPNLQLSEINGDGIVDILVDKDNTFCGNGDGTFYVCNYTVDNEVSFTTDGWTDELIQHFSASGPIIASADFNDDSITDVINMVYMDTFTFDVSVPQPDGLPCPVVKGWRPYFDRGHWETRWGNIYDCTPQPNKTVTVRAPSVVGMQVSLMSSDGAVASQVINKTFNLDKALLQARITQNLVNSGNKIGRNSPYYWTSFVGITQPNLYHFLSQETFTRMLFLVGDPYSTNEYSTAKIVDANNDGKKDLLIGALSTKRLELSLGDGTFVESQEPVLKTQSISDANLGDFNGDGLLDVVYLDLPKESDHTLQLQLQVAALVNPTPVDPTPATLTGKIELVGVVSEAGNGYFIVNNTRVTIDASSIIKFEDDLGPNISAGITVDFKANTYSDGSVVAIKAQFGG